MQREEMEEQINVWIDEKKKGKKGREEGRKDNHTIHAFGFSKCAFKYFYIYRKIVRLVQRVPIHSCPSCPNCYICVLHLSKQMNQYIIIN